MVLAWQLSLHAHAGMAEQRAPGCVAAELELIGGSQATPTLQQWTQLTGHITTFLCLPTAAPGGGQGDCTAAHAPQAAHHLRDSRR